MIISLLFGPDVLRFVPKLSPNLPCSSLPGSSKPHPPPQNHMQQWGIKNLFLALIRSLPGSSSLRRYTGLIKTRRRNARPKGIRPVTPSKIGFYRVEMSAKRCATKTACLPPQTLNMLHWTSTYQESTIVKSMGRLKMVEMGGGG